MSDMLALVPVAVALGLDNFAAAIAIGLAGVDARTRLRVGVVFGAFEAGMPVAGLLIGAQAAGPLGHASRWVATGLLIALGGYVLAEALRSARAARHRPGESPVAGASAEQPGGRGLGRLVLAGLALSVDNLAVGFALGSYHTPVVVGAVTIGAVSVALALAGLELGARLGARVGERADQLAGLLLIAVGIAIGAGVLS